MPNWCRNQIVVRGDTEDIAKSVNCKFSFEVLRPCPLTEEEKEEVVKEYLWEVPRWNKWNGDNWGAKWDVNQEEVEIEHWADGSVFFKFDSAWSAPCELLRYVTEQMLSLTIKHRYFDEGCDMFGKCIYKGGVANY